MLIIVVDCLKGIQTQTAECMVIGEITTDKAIFVLNKIDLIPENEREERIKTITNTLQKTINRTRFKNAPIVCFLQQSEKQIPISAQVGGGSIEDQHTQNIGVFGLVYRIDIQMDKLVSVIKGMISIPEKTDNRIIFSYYI